MEPCKILIVDDHKIIRDGLKAIFKRHPRFAIVGDVDAEKDVFDFIRFNHVDIVLMDLHMPGFNGLDAAGQIKIVHPDTRVIMHTMSEAPANLLRAKELGIDGYVLKNDGQSELEKALTTVANGGTYFFRPNPGYKEISAI